MKKLIAIAFILACLSIAYYFGIFLPQIQTKAIKPAMSSNKTGLEMQEKCSIAARKFFEDEGFAKYQGVNYTCHYSKKRNKFYILLSVSGVPEEGFPSSTTLYDILSHEEIGGITLASFKNKAPTKWYLEDKSGEDMESWEEAIKSYMKD